jgi:hypothetical protein
VKIGDAFDLQSPLLGRAQDRKQNGRKDRDDGDDNQQFD